MVITLIEASGADCVRNIRRYEEEALETVIGFSLAADIAE
jgi:hypothetical protein